MLSSFDLISHTDRTLEQHLDGCYDIACRIVAQEMVGESLCGKKLVRQAVRLLVYYHDLGKATDFFQSRIIKAGKVQNPTFIVQHQTYIDYFENNKQTKAEALLKEDDRLGYHALLGAYFSTQYALSTDVMVGFIVFKIIKCHHQNLTNFFQSKSNRHQFYVDEKVKIYLKTQTAFLNKAGYQKILAKHQWDIEGTRLEEILQPFLKLRKFNTISRQLKKANTLKYFFLQHYLFSVLLSADKGDVMLENKSVIRANEMFPSAMIAEYKQAKFGAGDRLRGINRWREEAFEDIDKNVKAYAHHHFFSITLPTGMGKTLGVYHAAIQLQRAAYDITDKAKRIVYCLPFTSIIDQNTMVLTEVFAASGQDVNQIAKNHYLSALPSAYKENELTYDDAEYLTDGWEHDFIITTFVQLLESIFNNKNRQLRKFHNLANSIIVLDEVQNIPAKYYNLIAVTFQQMAAYFDTKFIFVTATQPMLMATTDVIELTDPDRVKTKMYFEKLDRIILDQSLYRAGVLELEVLVEHFKEDIDRHPDKSFLFILNTIASSQQVLEDLSEYEDLGYDLYYLSGGILPCLRKAIIEKIKTPSSTPKIVVTTQVVEAGVDIDLDIVYRDFAPMDSINQSAGRCNRNALKGKGYVKLFDSGKAKWIYDDTLLSITRNVLSGHDVQIPERAFYDLNQSYFGSIKEEIQKDNTTSLRLINYMKTLQLEHLAEEFKLIPQKDYSYNVFIPFDDEAKKVWEEYQACFEIKDHFEKKRAIKMLKPKLLQYVTQFPKHSYDPGPSQRDKPIIYELAWRQYYDLKKGFLQTPPTLAYF